MKTFKNIFILALFLIFFQSCASMKDGLSRSKKDNTDEFLVEKKNPLKLPPDYEVLPTPNQEELSEKEQSNNEIEKLLNVPKQNSKDRENLKKKKNSSLEEFLLEKVKSN